MLIDLRQAISDFLKFRVPTAPVLYQTHEHVNKDGYDRLRISYISEEGDQIPAFLLLPHGNAPFGAVLVHHQHHGQRHFGKSEVLGLVGDPLQAFAPALARQGIVVLAPDSICFEDRRRNRTGTQEDADADVEQHYDEMCFRLLRGDTLMRKVLSDSARGISLLRGLPQVDAERIGMLGHSYGGNTVLFHNALDERIRFSCSSGAACSYQYKTTHQVGIEMAEVIPGFTLHFDIADLAACSAPRALMIVSASDDMASYDADQIVLKAQETCAAMRETPRIDHMRYAGEHALTQERFDAIVDWMVARSLSTAKP